MVMIYHFWGYGVGPGIAGKAFSSVAEFGWAGVDLFFVLSGFLITGILWDSREQARYYRVFYARRLVRIFPLYYASLLLLLFVVPWLLALRHHPWLLHAYVEPRGEIYAWTYSLNWLIGLSSFSAASVLIQHFWSLSIEEQFYLVWPLLVRTLTRRRLLAACAAIVFIAPLMRIALILCHHPVGAYALTFCRADSLAVGAAIALALRDPGEWALVTKWARWSTPAALAVLIGFVCTLGSGVSPSPVGTTVFTVLAILFGGCVVLAIDSDPAGPGHRMVASPFLQSFGKYSYCLYICHQPLIALLAPMGLNGNKLALLLHSRVAAVFAVNAIGFALAISVAWLSWRLFESPLLKLKDLPMFQHRAEPPPPPELAEAA